MCDVIVALKLTNDTSEDGANFRPNSPSENENSNENENDWIDELNDDESDGEDSDDEGLNSKLCTFTQTQKVNLSSVRPKREFLPKPKH